MEYVITTYGGGELFTLVFNAIAALFKSDQTGMILSLIRVGLMVGLVYVVILMFFQSTLIEGMKWFLWVVVATNLLFLPKITIYIHDPLTKTKNKVDGVPFALGAFAGFVSTVGKTVTEKFESVFTLPNYMPYHQTGTVFASSLMGRLGQFRIVDPTFKGNMERFINQCVVYDAMIGHKYTLTDLQNQNDLWAFVSSKASPVLGFLYKDGNNPGEIITCKVGAQKLNTLWKAEIEKATSIYGSRVQNQGLTKTLFFSHLQNGYQLLSDVAKSAEDILKQEMMVNAIEEASNNKLSELGATSNYAATKALLQQRSAYAVAGEIAARTLPLFKNVIEALSYALFIFIVVLALLPTGYKILMTYFGILVWTQLWAPLYAVLNLIMTLYGKSETKSLLGEEGLTLLNSSAIINANADMVTLAAWLSVSIPFISYGIIKQGAAAFVGLAQHLGSAMQSAASGAAAETVSGNVSLGNVAMGTQAYQNTSAFQHNTSPTYNASQFKAMGVSGTETTTFAGGNQAFSDQALSKLSVQIMGTENTSFAEQQSLTHAENNLRTKSVAATEATEASLQSSTNFMSQLGTSKFKGEDYSKNITANEAKSLQNFNNFVDTLQKSNNLTETQATEVALAVGAGGNLGFFSAEAKGSFSSGAARQAAFEKGASLAKQLGYSESTDKVVAVAQSLSEGSHDTKGANVDSGALASLNHAKGLREEASIAQNQLDSISKDMSSSQSKGITISRELTQDVLDFIAHQPINPGPNGSSGGELGYKEARRILETGGDERAAYLSRFQEQNPQYAIQSIDVAGAQSALHSQYETQAQHQRDSVGVQAQHASNAQNVQSKAHAAGLDKTQTNLSTTSAKAKQPESPQKEALSYGTQNDNEMRTEMGVGTEIGAGIGISGAGSPQYEGLGQDQSQTQTQDSLVGVQTQHASNIQNVQAKAPVQSQVGTAGVSTQHASDTQGEQYQAHASNFGKAQENLSVISANTEQAQNIQKGNSSYAPESAHGVKMETGVGRETRADIPSVPTSQYENQGQFQSQAQDQAYAQTQSIPTTVPTQYTSNTQSEQSQISVAGLNKTSFDKENLGGVQAPLSQEKLENHQEQSEAEPSVKEFVENKLRDIDKKIEDGKQPIADQEKILQGVEKTSQEKTLGGTALKNLAVSGTKGVLSVGNNINEAIRKLPPPPDILL